jgi:hypothetical protein
MAYLDISPMVTALRTRPSDFDMVGSWLRHIPSRHKFKVDRGGHVTLDAQCDCIYLSVSREQGRELWQEFAEWQTVYWRSVAINREFAAHFRKPNAWQRLYRDLRARWRNRRLPGPAPAPQAAEELEPEPISAPLPPLGSSVREKAPERELISA